MPYKLFLTQEFERQFAKLDTKTQDRVVEKLKDIQDDPEFFGKPLKHSLNLNSRKLGT